jgi:hypothetical protein
VAADLLVDEAAREHVTHLGDHLEPGRHAQLLAQLAQGSAVGE